MTANLSPETAPFGGGQVNPAGVNGLVQFTSPKVSTKDMASQICPRRSATYSAWSSLADPLSDAVECFSGEAADTSKWQSLRIRRNAVIGYVMLRSDQACALWVTYIERAGAVNRGVFNVASVVTGGVGALVSGDASRILSGASGIASGSGAAVDSAMLHGLTEGLILPRVAQVRATRRAAIVDQLDQDVAAYPVALALADVLHYHAACNVSSALQADTPGAVFGQELDRLIDNSSRIVAAKAAMSGARNPGPADVQPGTIFMSRAGEVFRVDTAPADARSGQTVGYTLVGSQKSKTSTDPKAFLELVKGGLVLQTP